MALFAQHLFQLPPRLRERAPDLPQAVEDVVLEALAKDPGQRFACVQDFAAILEELCQSTQPLSVRSLTAPEPPSPPILSLPQQERRTPKDEQENQDEVVTLPRPLVSAAPLLPTLFQRRLASSKRTLQAPRTQEPKPPFWLSNRQRFLRKVRSIWITGVLEHSLYGATLIALGLQEQPDAVALPWHLVLQSPDGSPRLLPEGTRIIKAYDEANGELLILGNPGSGKTTLLLDLARDLLVRAEQDERHPLPVIFPLSSWASNQPDLANWFVQELNTNYQVPRQLAQSLVHADLLLPLLDGLDEMPPPDRTACIEAINTYRQAHGFLPLVICCRSADYQAQASRLHLQNAVVVQPLSHQHIDTYLQQAGSPLAALRQAWRQDTDLQELAMTPLMLTILVLAYQGMPVRDLAPLRSLPEKQQQIFTHYVHRMITGKGNQKHYPLQHTSSWLRWLARQMREHNQTVFYLEHLQPDWLSERQRRIYTKWAILFPGVMLGLLASLVVILFTVSINANSYPYSIFNQYILSFIQYGIIGGFLGGLFSLSRDAEAPRPNVQAHTAPRWRLGRFMVAQLTSSVLVGLLSVLGFGLPLDQTLYHLIDQGVSYHLDAVLRAGSIPGMVMGLSTLLITLLLSPSPPQQPPRGARKTTSPWPSLFRSPQTRHVRRAFLVMMVFGSGIGLFYGLHYGLEQGLLYGMSSGFFYGLYSGLNIGLISLLISLILEAQTSSVLLVERLRWSWKSLLKSLLKLPHTGTSLLLTGLTSIMIGLSVGLNEWLLHLQYLLLKENDQYTIYNGIWQGLSAGLGIGLSYWLLLGIFQGIKSEQIEDQDRRVPNEGIQRSLRNSLLLGFISGMVIALVGALSSGLITKLAEMPYYLSNNNIIKVLMYVLFNNPQNDSVYGLWQIFFLSYFGWFLAVSGGLLVCLMSGGMGVWRHYVLRHLLWRFHSFPWQASPFLEDAVLRLLLRRVGGGYSFSHRLLLDYFATQEYSENFQSLVSRRVALVSLIGVGTTAIGGAITARLLAPHPHSTFSGTSLPITSLEWSLDGQRIIVSSLGSSVFDRDRMWQVWNTSEPGAPLFSSSYALQSPDGKNIIVIDKSRVRVRDAVSGKIRFSCTKLIHTENNAMWSPDGQSIIVTDGPFMGVWDASNGKLRFSFSAHFDNTGIEAWSPNSKDIVVLYRVEILQVRNISNGDVRFSFSGPASSVTWSPDGKNIVVEGFDRVKIIDASNGSLRFSFPKNIDVRHAPVGGQQSDGNNFIVTKQSTMEVRDVSDGDVRFSFPGSPNSVTWSPDGKNIIVQRDDTVVEVRDASNGSLRFSFAVKNQLSPFPRPLSLAWSPDGKNVAVVNGNTVQVRNASNGKQHIFFTGISYALHAVAWSPDSKSIAFANNDGTVHIWDALKGHLVALYWDGDELFTFPADKTMLALAWSPDGKFLASGDGRGHIQIWETPTTPG